MEQKKSLIVLIVLVILFIILIFVAKSSHTPKEVNLDYNYEFKTVKKEEINEEEEIAKELYNKYKISNNTESLDYYNNVDINNPSDKLVSYLLIKNLGLKKESYSFEEVENILNDLFKKETIKESYECIINNYKYTLIYNTENNNYNIVKEETTLNDYKFQSTMLEYKYNKNTLDIIEEYSYSIDETEYKGKLKFSFIKDKESYNIVNIKKVD